MQYMLTRFEAQTTTGTEDGNPGQMPYLIESIVSQMYDAKICFE